MGYNWGSLNNMLDFKQFLTEEKKMYKGTFNWHGENIKLSTDAISLSKAKTNMFHQLSKKVKVNVQSVQTYYKDRSSSYEIV